MSPSRPRAVDLACDRALQGLDPAQEMELASLLGPTDDVALRLEKAAAAVTLSELVIDEPLPAHLAAAVLASAGGAGQVRSPGGTVALPGSTPPFAAGAGWRDPAATRVMPERRSVAPASMPPAGGSGNVIALQPRPARSSGRAVLAWSGWIAAAACFALLVGVVLRRPPGGDPTVEVVASAAERRDKLVAEAKDLVRVPWGATEDPAGKGETGEVVWSTARQEGYMTFRGLAANDPSKEQYQLWIFDAERDEKYPVDGGVFDVKPGGEIVVPITARVAVAQPKLFAVTVERPGGVVVSKRERIAVAAPVKG